MLGGTQRRPSTRSSIYATRDAFQRCVRPAGHNVAMSCMEVDPTTLAILDDLAVSSATECAADAVATRIGNDVGTVLRLLDELAAIGWVFGGPGRCQLTGVGHSHTSHAPPSGLLGGS